MPAEETHDDWLTKDVTTYDYMPVDDDDGDNVGHDTNDHKHVAYNE